MIDFLGGIQNFVTVFGKWIFNINISFALSLTCKNLDCCRANDDESKVRNGYTVVLKYMELFITDKNKSFDQKKMKSCLMFKVHIKRVTFILNQWK